MERHLLEQSPSPSPPPPRRGPGSPDTPPSGAGKTGSDARAAASDPADASYEFAPKTPEEGAPHKPPVVAPSPDMLVERTCPHCGFRIVGKPPRGRCPDCNAPLELGIADLLQFSSAAWVRWIAWGPLMLVAAIALHVGAVIYCLTHPMPAALGQLLHAGGAVIACAGIWCVTSGPPGGGGVPHRRPLMALLARWLSVVVAISWVLVWAFATMGRMPAMNAFMVIAIALMIAESIPLAGFLNGLAARIPNDSLVHQFLNLVWIAPVLLGLGLIHQVGQSYRLYDLTIFFTSIFFCTFPLAGVVAGLVAWATVALMKLTLELRHAAVTIEAIGVRRAAREAKAAAIREATKKK